MKWVWLFAAPLGLLGVLVLTLGAFGLPIGSSLGLIAQGAFGDRLGLATTLVQTTPLLVASLGILLAWRAGVYNIGGEGQYIVGALVGAAVALAIRGAPGALATPILLGACAAGGGIFAWLAGWLQERRGVPVVISTILLNFVAAHLHTWAVSGPLREASGMTPRTEGLPSSWMLPRLDPQTSLHGGVILAGLLVPLVAICLFHTRGGYRLRFVGQNPRVSRSFGIDVSKTRISAMAASGALCGLAGGITLLGVSGRVGLGFGESWGFLAIPVALLGALNPYGVLCSSLYFGMVVSGARNLTGFSDAKTTLVSVIQGVAVLGFLLIWELMNRRRARQATA